MRAVAGTRGSTQFSPAPAPRTSPPPRRGRVPELRVPRPPPAGLRRPGAGREPARGARRARRRQKEGPGARPKDGASSKRGHLTNGAVARRRRHCPGSPAALCPRAARPPVRPDAGETLRGAPRSGSAGTAGTYGPPRAGHPGPHSVHTRDGHAAAPAIRCKWTSGRRATGQVSVRLGSSVVPF